MVWRFLTHYGVTKATELAENFAAAVVSFDPATASKSQVALMEAELTKLSRRLAEAEAEVRRENEELRVIKAEYAQYLDAAGLLEQRLAAATDPDEKAEIETSLAKLADMLERMKGEIEREDQEAATVEAWRAELRKSFEALAAKIKTVHRDMNTARRTLEMARLEKERAESERQRARELAGLETSINSVNVALSSMNKETARVRADTEALKLKASVMQGKEPPLDRAIAAVLEEARRRHSLDKGSPSERIARLKSASAPKRVALSSVA